MVLRDEKNFLKSSQEICPVKSEKGHGSYVRLINPRQKEGNAKYFFPVQWIFTLGALGYISSLLPMLLLCLTSILYIPRTQTCFFPTHLDTIYRSKCSRSFCFQSLQHNQTPSSLPTSIKYQTQYQFNISDTNICRVLFCSPPATS